MAKSWEEVKTVLDDPAVSPETKQALLSSWLNTPEGWQADRDEVEPYSEAYNAFPVGFGGSNVDDLYQDAQDESDQGSYNDREQGEAVDQGKQDLESARPPAVGGVGTKTSDELLDTAVAALKVFQNFGPLLAELPADCVGQTRPLDFNTDIKKRFDEQRGISFENFLTDAERFSTGATTVDTTMRDTQGQLSSLFQNWTGDAADAAHDHYSEKIAPKAQELSRDLTSAAEAVEIAVDAVYQLVKGKADAVNDLYTDQVGKADLAMAQKVINIANGSAAGKDELADVAGWMDVNFGTNLRETLNDDACCDDDDIKEEGIRLAKQWIQNQFNPDMWDWLYLSFDRTCTDTLDLVNQAYDALDDVMGDLENEFQGATDQPPTPEREDGGGGDTGGGGGGTGGGTGGGGTGGGTGGGAEVPSTEQPGTNPVTGKPLEVDPETGKPYPIDPETGEAIKDAGDDRDTLTVEQGDRTIEMNEPDAEGEMEISVDDGSGEPKEYKLDFSAEEGTEGTAGDGEQAGEFGPEGSKDGAEQIYRPGPDGKIHIEDGDLKITAEQPEGPDGPTVVTVDDGTGEPTTYTLGEEKAAGEPRTAGPRGDAGAGGEQSAGGSGGSGSGSADSPGEGAESGDDIRTMPAPDDGSVPISAEAGADEGGAGGGAGDGAAGGGSGGGGSGGADGGGADGAGSGGAGSDGAGSGGDGGAQTEPQSVGAGASGGIAAGVDAGAGGVSSGVGEPVMDGGVQTSATPQPSAGLGMAPGGVAEPVAAGAAQGASGGMGGGMGMMGGGMAAGAGGGGGGDQERGSSQYRVDGGIFETSGSANRISGSLDDEGDRSISYER